MNKIWFFNKKNNFYLVLLIFLLNFNENLFSARKLVLPLEEKKDVPAPLPTPAIENPILQPTLPLEKNEIDSIDLRILTLNEELKKILSDKKEFENDLEKQAKAVEMLIELNELKEIKAKRAKPTTPKKQDSKEEFKLPEYPKQDIFKEKSEKYREKVKKSL